MNLQINALVLLTSWHFPNSFSEANPELTAKLWYKYAFHNHNKRQLNTPSLGPEGKTKLQRLNTSTHQHINDTTHQRFNHPNFLAHLLKLKKNTTFAHESDKTVLTEQAFLYEKTLFV